MILQHGGEVALSLQSTGVSHIICNSDAYRYDEWCPYSITLKIFGCSDDALAAVVEGRHSDKTIPALKPSWMCVF
jgi:hypothetical protein